MRSRRLWPVFAIVIASLALGIGTTAALYALQPSGRNGSATAHAPYPASPELWGPAAGPGVMGRSPVAPPSCAAPALPGTVVDVTVTDMGAMMGPGMMGRGMMGPGRNGGWDGQGPDQIQWPHMGMMGRAGMMRIFVSPAEAPAGQVSFRVHNTGWLNHELVVLPLASGRYPGQRAIGPDGRVDESAGLGEASRTCGAGEGDGIAPGATGWTTISLAPGRYEFVCNIAGHYGAGMYAELDVVG